MTEQKRIEITSNSDILQLKNEFFKHANATNLVLTFEIQVEKEQEIFTCVANQLQAIPNLKGLSLVFTKYSLFRHFNVLTNALSLLQNLTDLSIHIQKQCYFQDSHLKDLTECIAQLQNLIRFSLILKKGSQISSDSSSHLYSCINQLPLLESLNLQIEDTAYFHRSETYTGMSTAIKNCQKLRELIIFIDTNFSDNTLISEIGEAIASLSSLEILEVRLNQLSNKKFIIELLMNSISKLQFLKKLKLENEEQEKPKLESKDIDSIKNCLVKLSHLESLEINNFIDHDVHQIMNESESLHQISEWSQNININEKTSNCEHEQNDQYEWFSKFNNLKNLSLKVESTHSKPNDFFVSLAKGFSHMFQLESLQILVWEIFDVKYFFGEIQKLAKLQSLVLNWHRFQIDQYSVNNLDKSLKELKLLKNLKLEFMIKEDVNTSCLMNTIQNLLNLEELFLTFESSLNRMNNLTKLKNLTIKDLIIQQEKDDGDAAENEIEEENNDLITTSVNKIDFFQYLSKLTTMLNLDLKIQTPMSQKNYLQLSNALFEMKQLQRAAISMRNISLRDFYEIMEGLQSEKLDSLSLSFNHLVGTLGQHITQFKPLNSLKCFQLFISYYEEEEDTYKLMKLIFNHLPNLQKFKITSDLTKDFFKILSDFISDSPQLLNLKIQNISYPLMEYERKEKEAFTFDQSLLQYHKLRKVSFRSNQNLQSAGNFLQFHNLQKVYIRDNIRTGLRFGKGRKKLSMEKSNKNQMKENTNCQIECHSKYLIDLNILSLDSIIQQLPHQTYLQKFQFENILGLSCQGLSELGAALQKLERIEFLTLKLYFPETAVDKESLVQLSKGIKNQKNLKDFQFRIFSDCDIDNVGLATFVDALQFLTCLQTLTIEIDKDNGNDNTWLFNLGKSLSSLKLLEIFSLIIGDENAEEQHIGDGVKSIGESFKFLSQLKQLTLKFLQIHAIIEEQGAISLGKGISNLSNLQKIKLYLGEDCVQTQQSGGLSIIEGVINLTNLLSIEIFLNEINNKKSVTMHRLTSNLYKMNSLGQLTLNVKGDSFDGKQFDLETFLALQQSIKMLQFQIRILEDKIICSLSSEYPFIQLYFLFQINNDNLPEDIILKNSKALNKYPLNYSFELDIKSSNISNRNLICLVKQLSSLETSTLTLIVGRQCEIKLVDIFQEISKMRNLKNLSFDLYYDYQVTYEDLQKSIQLLSLTKSDQIQKLDIFWQSFNSQENQKAYLELISEISKFTKLRVLLLDVEFSSITSKLAIYKQLMKKLLKPVHIVLNETSFQELLSQNKEEEDENTDELEEEQQDEDEEEEEEEEVSGDNYDFQEGPEQEDSQNLLNNNSLDEEEDEQIELDEENEENSDLE